jgi:hypothetical protein
MKINEVAQIQINVDEAPVGMLKRAATKIASKVPGATGAKMADQVQSTANALYKEFMAITKNSPAGKPTDSGLVQYLQGKGFPVQDMAQLKKSASQAQKLANKVQPGSMQDKLKGIGKQIGKTVNKMTAKPDGDGPENNPPGGASAPNPNNVVQMKNLAAGMYEAQQPKLISNKEVEQLIMFAVQQSFENDQITNLKPGAFTPKYKEYMKTAKSSGNTGAGKGGLVKGDDGIYRFQ